LDHCLALGRGADYLVRHGLARAITRERAREVLDYAREHGNVQMADNVRERPGFICNCCKCCCEMMEGFRSLPHTAKVVSSNYLAVSNGKACNGCGKCSKVCPIDAIVMEAADPTPLAPKRKSRARIDAERCLGCGVCYGACKFAGITMSRAPTRVYTPENTIERMARQAIERGKLQNLLFNDPSRLTHRTLGAFFGVLLKLPPAKQALASEQLKSRFVHLLLSRGGLALRRRSERSLA
jgi:ferredoxin